MFREFKAIAAALMILLAGCASTGGSKSASIRQAEYKLDQDYVNQVNAQARASGVTVLWMNLPVTRVDKRD